MTSISDTGSCDSDSLPDSINARSRISLIRSSRYHPALIIWCSLTVCASVGGGEPAYQLSEAKDCIERGAQLMAHSGKKFGFCKVGFFRHRLGALQLGIFFLQYLIQVFAFGDVARRAVYHLLSVNLQP